IPDVPCRVDVSVAGVSAGPAPVGGLVLARLPVHDPARRAPLTRVRGVDLLDAAGHQAGLRSPRNPWGGGRAAEAIPKYRRKRAERRPSWPRRTRSPSAAPVSARAANGSSSTVSARKSASG